MLSHAIAVLPHPASHRVQHASAPQGCSTKPGLCVREGPIRAVTCSALSLAGHDADLVSSLLASLLQLARNSRRADRLHTPDAMQQELGLDSTGLPTEAFFERLAVDADGLEADLLAETLLRLVAVGDASVLPLVSPSRPAPLLRPSHDISCQGHAARLQGTAAIWHRNKSGSWHRQSVAGLCRRCLTKLRAFSLQRGLRRTCGGSRRRLLRGRASCSISSASPPDRAPNQPLRCASWACIAKELSMLSTKQDLK